MVFLQFLRVLEKRIIRLFKKFSEIERRNKEKSRSEGTEIGLFFFKELVVKSGISGVKDNSDGKKRAKGVQT